LIKKVVLDKCAFLLFTEPVVDDTEEVDEFVLLQKGFAEDVELGLLFIVFVRLLEIRRAG
jgi:hypothetical protein